MKITSNNYDLLLAIIGIFVLIIPLFWPKSVNDESRPGLKRFGKGALFLLILAILGVIITGKKNQLNEDLQKEKSKKISYNDSVSNLKIDSIKSVLGVVSGQLDGIKDGLPKDKTVYRDTSSSNCLVTICTTENIMTEKFSFEDSVHIKVNFCSNGKQIHGFNAECATLLRLPNGEFESIINPISVAQLDVNPPASPFVEQYFQLIHPLNNADTMIFYLKFSWKNHEKKIKLPVRLLLILNVQHKSFSVLGDQELLIRASTALKNNGRW